MVIESAHSCDGLLGGSPDRLPRPLGWSYEEGPRIISPAMKLQFGTDALLMVTAIIGISVCGSLAALRQWPAMMAVNGVCAAASLAPFWVPFVFVAFALGRKRLTWSWTLGFALAEAAAVISPIVLILIFSN